MRISPCPWGWFSPAEASGTLPFVFYFDSSLIDLSWKDVSKMFPFVFLHSLWNAEASTFQGPFSTMDRQVFVQKAMRTEITEDRCPVGSAGGPAQEAAGLTLLF